MAEAFSNKKYVLNRMRHEAYWINGRELNQENVKELVKEAIKWHPEFYRCIFERFSSRDYDEPTIEFDVAEEILMQYKDKISSLRRAIMEDEFGAIVYKALKACYLKSCKQENIDPNLEEKYEPITDGIEYSIQEKDDFIEWKIDQDLLSKMKKADKDQIFTTQEFTRFNCKWKLECYPNTKPDDGGWGRSYFHMYLILVKLGSNMDEIAITCRMYLEEQNKEFMNNVIFTSRTKMWGHDNVTTLEEASDSLTFRIAMDNPLRKDNDMITWNITGWLLQKYRSYEDWFYSPPFNSCGMVCQIGCRPNNSKSKSDLEIKFLENGVLANGESFDVDFVIECDQANYQQKMNHTIDKWKTEWGGKGYNYVSLEEAFSAGIFAKSESITFKFKIFSRSQSYAALKRMVYICDAQEIALKSINKEFRAHDKIWKMSIGSTQISLLSKEQDIAKRSNAEMIYSKIECNDINIDAGKIITFTHHDDTKYDEKEDTPNDYQLNHNVAYNIGLLKNKQYITVVVNVTDIPNGIVKGIANKMENEIKKLKEELDRLKQETQEYRLKAINFIPNDGDYKDTKCDELLNRHRNIIDNWNLTTTKLKSVSSQNKADIEEKKEQKEDILSSNALLDKYMDVNTLINKQLKRIDEVKTDKHLSQVLNHQETILKSIKEKELKLPLEENKYIKQNKEYQKSKCELEKQRNDIKKKIIVQVGKYNELIDNENEQLKQLHEIEIVKNKMIIDIQSLRESHGCSIEIVKFYNEFVENNKKYIEDVNTKFDKLWTDFESKWKEWNVEEIIIWFKYKTITMKTDNIQWKKIEDMLKTRNVCGKSLQEFNELTFDFMFQNSEIVNHLISEVKMLKRKGNDNDGNENIPYKIPSLFICPITKKIMQDPVTAFDGYCYEREAIEKYLKINNKSPITGANADYVIVFPNHRLKEEIRKYIKENNIDIDTTNIDHEGNETAFI
eukprot:235691_1